MDQLKDLNNVYIGSIYGAKTKQGLIEIKIDDFHQQWTILDAKKIAYMILEACEAASTDEVLIEFFKKMGFPQEQLGQMLFLLREHRGKVDPHFFEV